ncbi:MAG: SixA phosphatase family protein [Propioniciclava sp.]
MKQVYLIRHGEAEFTGAGRGDHGRALTAEGREQARRLGELLSDAGIEMILTSSADRAAQTARGMGLAAPVEMREELYNASTMGIARVLAEVPDHVATVALVAHAPGIPAFVDQLSGEGSDADALRLVQHHYPTATATGVGFTGTWADLEGAHLTWADRG